MLWWQFYFQNFHFAANFLMVLVFFAVFWLYFDAWQVKRNWREVPRLSGLLLLAASYVVSASVVETTGIALSFWQSEWILVLIVRLLGYLFLITGLIVEPLQNKPDTESIVDRMHQAVVLPGAGVLGWKVGFAWLPILSLGAFGAYMYRATIGLERHLKPMAYGLLALTFKELFGLARLFWGTKNVDLFNLVAPFKLFWWLEHAALLLAVLIIGRWIWGYLLRRIQSQLFMVFTFMTLIVFLITTTVFTGILLVNLQAEIETRMKTDVQVLEYALEQQRERLLSDAQALSSQPVVTSMLSGEAEASSQRLVPLAVEGEHPLLMVTDAYGGILARADNPDVVGQSVSDDVVVARALAGEEYAGVEARESGLVPEVWLKAAAPVTAGGVQQGVLVVGQVVDTAFVDGIKESTGLDASLYAGDVLAASTYELSDGQRWVGSKLSDDEVREMVLEQGETYVGGVSILNIPYVAAYAPLKNGAGVPVGMMFVGAPQAQVIKTATDSVILTFRIAALLMVLAVIPAWWFAKYITYQVR